MAPIVLACHDQWSAEWTAAHFDQTCHWAVMTRDTSAGTIVLLWTQCVSLANVTIILREQEATSVLLKLVTFGHAACPVHVYQHVTTVHLHPPSLYLTNEHSAGLCCSGHLRAAETQKPISVSDQ